MEIGKLGVFCSMDAMPACGGFGKLRQRSADRCSGRVGQRGHDHDRINAQLDAGANYVCVMPLESDIVPLSDECLLEALAPH
jgi:hypothetical protein